MSTTYVDEIRGGRPACIKQCMDGRQRERNEDDQHNARLTSGTWAVEAYLGIRPIDAFKLRDRHLRLEPVLRRAAANLVHERFELVAVPMREDNELSA